MSTTPLISIAVLKAKTGQREALRDALSALVAPTRQEPGCLDYTLFELRDEPGHEPQRWDLPLVGRAFGDVAPRPHHRAINAFQRFPNRLLLLGAGWCRARRGILGGGHSRHQQHNQQPDY